MKMAHEAGTCNIFTILKLNANSPTVGMRSGSWGLRGYVFSGTGSLHLSEIITYGDVSFWSPETLYITVPTMIAVRLRNTMEGSSDLRLTLLCRNHCYAPRRFQGNSFQVGRQVLYAEFHRTARPKGTNKL